MLKYKIKLNEPKGFDEIYTESLYLSPDLSFISGLTDNTNDLVDGQTVMVELNSDELFREAVIHLENIIIKGYVSQDENYIVNDIEGKKCIRYKDGKVYVLDAYAKVGENSIHLSNGRYYEEDEKGNYKTLTPTEHIDYKVKINGIEYEFKDKTNNIDKVTLPTKYYVEDDKITIDDAVYDVTYEYKLSNNLTYVVDTNYPPYITLMNGTMLFVKDYTENKWRNAKKFIIYKNNDIDVKVDLAKCTKKVPYFLYDVSIGLSKGVLKDNGYTKQYFKDEVITVIKNDKRKTDVFKISEVRSKINNSVIEHFMIDEDSKKVVNLISENNEYRVNESVTYPINYDFVNTMYGDLITLYVNETSLPFQTGKKITVESFSDNEIRYPLMEEYVDENKVRQYIIYGGKQCYVENETVDFVEICGKQYEVIYSDLVKDVMEKASRTKEENNDSKYGYIVQDETPFSVEVYDNSTKAKIYNTIEYVLEDNKLSTSILETDLIKRNFIVINNVKHLVENVSYEIEGVKTVNEDYVILPLNEKYVLNINEIKSNNCLICNIVSDIPTNNTSVCNSICNNIEKYKFYLENNIFEKNMVSMDEKVIQYDLGYGSDSIKLFNPCNYIDVPIQVINEYGNNMMQDNIVNEYFTKTEREARINKIVDMERIVYVPSFLIDGGDASKKPKFKNIDTIKFNLHFRTRDKEWKIIDEMDSGGDTSVIKQKDSWNIFDAYNYSNNTENTTEESLYPNVDAKDNMSYNQPSDLLGFLDFTNDDVFFQKSKLGKSFLRLLFFNSNDPINNTLLYSSTIFINEGLLYKKYIDNIYLNDSEYTKILTHPNDTEGEVTLVSNNIGVDFELCKDGDVTFSDLGKRLDSSLEIKNRYECSESSEGFYLYIYKEYCERLHEEPIYMKVEFNHAGKGRIINFMLPFNKDEDGYHLVDLSPESTELEEFKKGYPISEIVEHMYIPLESVYDFENKRYCYYMPYWMTHDENGNVINGNDTSMLFNLYEVKIKDESNIN